MTNTSDKSEKNKIVIISFCGDVGKTSLTSKLLLPRITPPIPSHCVFSFESLNGGLAEDGVSANTIKADKFNQVVDSIMLADCALVDVGQSNAEEFVKRMEQLEGSHEEFDYFIVPVIDSLHAIKEAIKTVESLHVMGVPAKKIKIIFNKVADITEDIEYKFAKIMALKQLKKATVNTNAVVYKSDAFDLLKDLQLSIEDVLNDPVNYRDGLKAVMGTSQEPYYLKRIALKRLCGSVVKNLDNAFIELRL